MWKANVLRGLVLLQDCFGLVLSYKAGALLLSHFSRVRSVWSHRQQPSSKRLRQGILEIGQRLDRLGAGSNQPNVLFFFHLWVREFFVLHRMVGRTWRGVLTPGYFELCSFPSIYIWDLQFTVPEINIFQLYYFKQAFFSPSFTVKFFRNITWPCCLGLNCSNS